MSTRRVYTPITTPLVVKRSFSGLGLGLFAGEAIPKGACIIEYVGREISEAEKYSSKSKYLFEIDSKKTLDGKPSINKAGYINHSHKPNAEPVISKRRIYIFAKKTIPAGEEITYDYGEEYVNDYCTPCHCEKCDPKLHAMNKKASVVKTA